MPHSRHAAQPATRAHCVTWFHKLHSTFSLPALISLQALSDGKPLIIEGSHLDLGALLPELSTRGLVLLPAYAAGVLPPVVL